LAQADHQPRRGGADDGGGGGGALSARPSFETPASAIAPAGSSG
jgi:hypothetical protein